MKTISLDATTANELIDSLTDQMVAGLLDTCAENRARADYNRWTRRMARREEVAS
jgi:hypothetical protein